MCDDSEPDDYADEDEPHEHEQPDDDPAPTPGERLLYALGQLYRLYRHGALNVRPIAFDVWDLAGIIGVRSDIEFVSEDKLGAPTTSRTRCSKSRSARTRTSPGDCSASWTGLPNKN